MWAALAGGLAAASLVYLLTRPAKGVSRANFDKIQVGWTIPQVEDVLGPGRSIAGSWFWGDIVGDTIIVEVDSNQLVRDKRIVPDNLTDAERIYRKTRANVREALNLQAEP
jgi:hypothetical protein